MAFTQDLEASSCKICKEILTVSKQNCLFRRLPCGHTYLHSFEKSNKDCDGSSGDPVKSEKKFLEVGFWGGCTGNSWDDGVFDGVWAVTVQFKNCICSIQVVYDRNGIPINGEKHGYADYDLSALIQLDYPSEYFVCIRGHVSLVDNKWLVVRSLTFETNKRSYGPYGKEEGLLFTFPLNGMRIVGFQGRSGSYLDAIGFHVSTTEASHNAARKEKLVMSTREILEELLVSTRQMMIAMNLSADDDVSAASAV